MRNQEEIVSGFAPTQSTSEKIPEQNGAPLAPITPQDPEIEQFLNKRFSWGGLLGPMYWWAHHLNRQALKTFIPLYGNNYIKQLAILRGRRIVWESGVYKGDFTAFKKRQLLIDRIGTTFLIVCLLIVAACVAIIIFVPNKSIAGYYAEKDISGQYLGIVPVENRKIHITGLAFIIAEEQAKSVLVFFKTFNLPLTERAKAFLV